MASTSGEEFSVIAVALTSQLQRAGFPLTLELHARQLPKKSWVKIAKSERSRSNG